MKKVSNIVVLSIFLCFLAILLPVTAFAGILFVESFDDAAFSTRGWYDNTNLTISNSEYFKGSSGSVEFYFPEGATTPVSGGAIRKKFSESDSIYVSYYVKYSFNWQGSNKPYHPHEFYILTNLDGDWTGPAYTYMTAYIEQNEGVPLVTLQDVIAITVKAMSHAITWVVYTGTGNIGKQSKSISRTGLENTTRTNGILLRHILSLTVFPAELVWLTGWFNTGMTLS